MEKKEKDGRIYLNVPFEEKEEAKKLGAKWDPGRKLWYIPKDMVFERSIDVRQLLHSWYEEPPVKSEPLKIPTKESNFLLKKLKNLLSVASALYDEKSQNKILYLQTRELCMKFLSNTSDEKRPVYFLVAMTTELTGLLYCLL